MCTYAPIHTHPHMCMDIHNHVHNVTQICSHLHPRTCTHSQLHMHSHKYTHHIHGHVHTNKPCTCMTHMHKCTHQCVHNSHVCIPQYTFTSMYSEAHTSPTDVNTPHTMCVCWNLTQPYCVEILPSRAHGDPTGLQADEHSCSLTWDSHLDTFRA